MAKHLQYAISSLNARELAKAFDKSNELLPPVKVSEGNKYITLKTGMVIVKQWVGKAVSKKSIYGTNYHKYFLLANDATEAKSLMQEHCSLSDFCFRDMNFNFDIESE